LPQSLSEKCHPGEGQVALTRSGCENAFRRMRKAARWMRAPPVLQTGSQAGWRLLHDYLDEATRDIISRAVHGDRSEAVEQPSLPL
jgi:hypothetical protein